MNIKSISMSIIVVLISQNLFAGWWPFSSDEKDECSIAVDFGRGATHPYTIYLDWDETEHKFRTLSEAVKTRDEMVKSGICILPKNLPTCRIQTNDEDARFFVIQGDYYIIGWDYDINKANKLKGSYVDAKICVNPQN